ncbi:hypothetical protein PI124_g20462 [Phytophthora idaei]|nr:hypothetical protein PI124_g20462 [Phytophthora idaei]
MESKNDDASEQDRPMLPREWEQTKWAQEEKGNAPHREEINQEQGGAKGSNSTAERSKEMEDTTMMEEGEQATEDEHDFRAYDVDMGEQKDHGHDQNDDDPRAASATTELQKSVMKTEAVAQEGQTEVEREARTRVTNTVNIWGRQARSLSPKIRLSDNWQLDRDSEMGRSSNTSKTNISGEAGSKRPGSEREESSRGSKKNKQPTQQYMHKFLTTQFEAQGAASDAVNDKNMSKSTLSGPPVAVEESVSREDANKLE